MRTVAIEAKKSFIGFPFKKSGIPLGVPLSRPAAVTWNYSFRNLCVSSIERAYIQTAASSFIAP